MRVFILLIPTPRRGGSCFATRELPAAPTGPVGRSAKPGRSRRVAGLEGGHHASDEPDDASSRGRHPVGTHTAAWASQPRPAVNLVCHDGTPVVTSQTVSTENGDFTVNAQCDSDQMRDGRCTLTATVTFTGVHCSGCVVNVRPAVIRAGHTRVV